jgi:lipopolysaccharide export system permease protein
MLSFIISFLFFFIIFFINQLLLMAEDILSRKAAIIDVAKLVIFAMPAIIAMSFPFGSLVGALMASARMANDSEILVMRASGVPTRTIFLPFIILGMLFAMVSFVMNDVLLPLGTINYGKLYRTLITTAPALELGPHVVKRYKDTIIITGDQEHGILHDIVIMDTTQAGKKRVIGAGTARLVDRGDQSGTISIILSDVFVQESDPSRPERFEFSTADGMEYNLMLSSFSDFSTSIGPREMSSVDVLAVIRQKEAVLAQRIALRDLDLAERRADLQQDYLNRALQMGPIDGSASRLKPAVDTIAMQDVRPLSDRSLDIYRLEYYKKFSIPAGALVFVFLAFPLGIRAHKSGRASGFGIGLFVAVLYWAMLIGGQTLGLRTEFSPFIAMWAPNILILLISFPLLLLGRSR